MAKSIVSLAIGCAIDDGFIKNVDQPVSDFYPEFQGYNGKVLTLRHLLTMSAGVDFDEAYSSPFSPTTKLYYGDDLEKIALGMKETEEPGVNFIYQSGVTQLLSLIVEKATGENISSYVSRKLWTPMNAVVVLRLYPCLWSSCFYGPVFKDRILVDLREQMNQRTTQIIIGGQYQIASDTT